MKTGVSKKRKVLLLIFISLLIILSFVSAGDVAYIYKNKAKIDKNVVSVFEELGLTVELISEKAIPSDFSKYKFIFVGDERFNNIQKIPVGEVPSIISNYYFGHEFGLTDKDGVSQLAASSPLNVKKGGNVIQVYTKATFNGVSIPYYFLANENKVPQMATVAGAYTGDGIIGDVISYAKSGTDLLNGKDSQGNICFFGIIESNYWTKEARNMFKECTEFVGVSCKTNSDCPAVKKGEPYCKDDNVYQDIEKFECLNPGTFKSQCVDDVESKLLKDCESGCNNGKCICNDKDGDGFDECSQGSEGDDGKKKDCNDNDNKIYPNAPDIMCNGIDNDCDNLIDEDYVEKITSCGTGECTANGKIQCVNGVETDSCAPKSPSADICDGKDNDCDSQTDENNGLCESGKICNVGQCVPVACSKNSDCGTDGYVGNNYCDDDVYRDFKEFKCNNPGTLNSFCESKVSKKLIEQCSSDETCDNGQCVIKCKDNDNDNYDDCEIGKPGDDGKKKDCNDNDNKIYPGAEEVCDGKDNDCDGKIDEADGDLCSAGSVCVFGSCQQVACSKESDCGNDGFIDGVFCKQDDVYQNYVDWTCENPGTISSSCSKKVESRLVTDCTQSCSNGMCVDIVCNKDSDCNDNNDKTKDSCVKPGTLESYCKHEPIMCTKNSDCDDNNQRTADICNNPGTINSFCTHEDIVCLENADCGTDGFIDGLYCGDNSKNVYQNFRSWKCENSGTISSSCTQTISPKLVVQCDNSCAEGSCVTIVCNKDSDCNDNNDKTVDKCKNPGTINSFCTYEGISCFKDSDCGVDRFTGGLSCFGKDVQRDFINFTCKNPGTKNSFCVQDIDNKKVHSCLYACSEGNCIRCNTNSDCDDGKSTTVDSCRFAGTIDSYCKHETVQCIQNSDCGTNNFVGSPFCKFDDVYQKFRSWDCKNPSTTGSFCNFDEEDRKIEECEFGCFAGKCKQKPQTQCNDNKDNDNDKLIDAQDPGCWDDLSDPRSYNPNLNDESRGGVVCFKNSDCGTDGYAGENFCYLDDVYREFKTYSCSNPGTGVSQCFNTESIKLVEQCLQGETCSNGQCVPVTCSKDSDCGTDGYVGNNYCSNKTVYRDYKEYNCLNPGKSNSYCESNASKKLIEQCTANQVCTDGSCMEFHAFCSKNSDCGTDKFIGDKFCKNNDVYQNYKVFSCLNPNTPQSSCNSQVDPLLVESCNSNEVCTNGACLPVMCLKDSDCGTDGFVGGNYCKNGNVYRDFKTFECKNPGTSTSSCSSDLTSSLIETCANGCLSGKCITTIPSIKILSPLNNSVITTEDVTVTFQAMNWNVGGKGETHVHFHIDNIPGLSFSDHLMFYNGNNKIVELNLEPGTTVFATWINENTIRLNNVPDGTHRIRAHLAKVDHSLPGNPEAIYDIIIHVHTAKQCVDKDGDSYGENCDKGPDCNDNDNKIHPGAVEVCDGKDNDCDGKIDENDGDLCSSGGICLFGSCMGVVCSKNSDCGTDGFIGDNFCKNNDIYQKFKEYKCNNPRTIFSYCTSDTEILLKKQCEIACSNGQCTGECIKDEDCPNDFSSSSYCSDKSVVKDFHDFSCVNYSCKENVKTTTIEMCSELCVNGECINISCFKDSDCGTDGFIGDNFCKDGDVYKKFEEFSCKNPGTKNSMCDSSKKDKLVENCPNGCNNGKCITEICDDGIDNDGDGKVDKLKELNPQNGEILKVTNPFKITGSAIINNSNKKFGFSLFSKEGTAVLRSLDKKVNTATLQKICNIYGYANVKSHACVSPDYENRCNFYSPHDNQLWIYNTFLKDFKLIEAKNTDSQGEREWLSEIVCEHRLPACSDGWDNDGDGKIDDKDPGCANKFDDDEREHDPDCQL